MAGLSDQQVADLKEAFFLFDKECNGNIPSSQIGYALRGVGCNFNEGTLQVCCVLRRAFTDDVSQEIMYSLTGPVEFAEFLTLYTKYYKTHDFSSEVNSAFQILDKAR